MSYEPHKLVAELQAKVWKLESQLNVAVSLLAEAGRDADVQAVKSTPNPDFQSASVWESVLSDLMHHSRSDVFAELNVAFGLQVQSVNHQMVSRGDMETELVAWDPATDTTYRVTAVVTPDRVAVLDISARREIH